MIKLMNIHQWSRLEAGQVLSFESDKPRTVRLEVAPSEPAVMRLAVIGGAEMEFMVPSRDVVEFFTDGAFTIGADVPVSIYTADMDVRYFEDEGKPSFARIVERRARNPELEEMERRMHLNFQRMLAEQALEREAVLAAREAALARAMAERKATDGRGTDTKTAAIATDVGDPSAQADDPANGGVSNEPA